MSYKIKCIIIDDEPTARNGLAEDIREIDFLEIAGIAGNAFEALELIHRVSPGLIFLDIEMPGLNGLDFLRLIKVKPLIILTTAYPQYALAGFELGVVDYLLKPIPADRLKLACNKALELYNYRNGETLKPVEPAFVYLKCDGVMEKIYFSEILYVEAANNYVYIHTVAKRLLTYHTLKGMENRLPAYQFVKVHKSFIVSKAHITQITRNEVYINEVRIPLSKNFKNDFQKGVIADNFFKR
jgi:two-component system LytT family response regulator